MYYCETCRVINEWPKSIGLSGGNCENCDIVSQFCYSYPTASLSTPLEVRRISLMPLDRPQYTASFSVDGMLGVRHFCVKQIVTRSPRRVVLKYGVGDLSNPDSDPILIGTVLDSPGNYAVRVLWDNMLWRPWDKDTDEFMDIVMGQISKKPPSDNK